MKMIMKAKRLSVALVAILLASRGAAAVESASSALGDELWGHCRAAAVRTLLEGGAKARLNEKDVTGSEAVYVAVVNKNAEVVKLLLDHGASPNPSRSGGETPLHMAVSRQCPEIVALLCAAKADVNAKNGRSATPLETAMTGVEFAREPELALKTLEALLFFTPDVNALDSCGRTCLNRVLGCNDAAVALSAVKRLVAAGASPDMADAAGNTLMHGVCALLGEAAGWKLSKDEYWVGKGTAQWDRAASLFLFLLEKNAALNAVNGEGFTPLHLCLKERPPLEAVKLIVEAGADPGAKTPDGKDALVLAKERRCGEDVQSYLAGKLPN